MTHLYPSEMAQNFYTAIVAWSVCFALTIAGSLVTRAHPEAELVGLVYSLTPKTTEADRRWWTSPVTWGSAVLVAALALNVLFW